MLIVFVNLDRGFVLSFAKTKKYHKKHKLEKGISMENKS